MAYTNVLEHPLDGASMSTGRVCVGSEYYVFLGLPGEEGCKNTRGATPFGRTPMVSPDLRPAVKFTRE
jgi:hypothetical protein